MYEIFLDNVLRLSIHLGCWARWKDAFGEEAAISDVAPAAAAASEDDGFDEVVTF